MTGWPQPGTDCHRLLEALADGRPRNHLTLYGLGMITHSRASDLRRHGYRIRVWREPHPNQRKGLYWYQLEGAPLPPAETSPAPPSPGGLAQVHGRHVSSLVSGDSAGENGAHQLSFLTVPTRAPIPVAQRTEGGAA